MASTALGRSRSHLPVWLGWVLGMALLCLAASWPTWAQQAQIPALQERVTDTTASIDAETLQHLTQTLAALEQRKGAQIAVLMVPSLDGEAIESYAQRAFEQWKLGRSGVDDGILFVIAKDDRRLRIEVGYGLEGAVTDLQAGRIIREQVAPRFQQGDFAGGVAAGVDSLVKLVDGEELPPPPAASQASSGSWDMEWLDWLLPLIIAAVALPPVLAAAGAALLLYLLTGNVVAAALGAMVAFLLSLAGRSAGSGPRGGSSSVSRRGGISSGGFGSSSGSSWGGGSSGGGFGGGGGRSGGGGASGGW